MPLPARFADPWGEKRRRGVPLHDAFAQSEFEHRTESKPQVIDATLSELLRLLVQKFLQLLAGDVPHEPGAERADKMNRDPVLFGHPRRCLPLLPVNGKVDELDEALERHRNSTGSSCLSESRSDG